MNLTEESFHYSSEKGGWSYSGMHPDIKNGYNGSSVVKVTMVYCYYSPCETELLKNMLEGNESYWQSVQVDDKPKFLSESVAPSAGHPTEFDTVSSLHVFVHDVKLYRFQWIQIDLQYLHKIVHVTIHSKKIFRIDEPYRPKVFTSLSQWAFLHNGAINCPLGIHFNYTILQYHCTHQLVSKYATVNGILAEEITTIDIVVTGEFCGKQMGVTSGLIWDFQVSTSTQTSIDLPIEYICLETPGAGLYIQVDLIVPMIVQGIMVQGKDKDSVSSFHVSYSVSGEQFKQYEDQTGNQIFTMSNISDATHSTIVWFSDDILATFVKIHLDEHGLNPCLKLELLGCPKYVTRDIRCQTGSTELGWAFVEGLNIPHDVTYVDLYIKETIKDCVSFCVERTRKCVSVTLKDNECHIYAMQRYKVLSYIKIDKGSNYAEKLCLKDVQNTHSSCGYEITGQQVLTSPSYPLHYGEDRVCSWHVIFPVGKTIRIHILEISLPTNNEINVCKDRLIISDEHEEGIIDDRYNNSILYSKSNEIHIKLMSCHRYKNSNILSISRFAIDLRESDLFGCGFISTTHLHNCTLPFGIISSPFYPATNSLISEMHWKLLGPPENYFMLLFREMNIPSDQECKLSYVGVYDFPGRDVTNRLLIGRYCTAKRTFNVIKSSWNKMLIEMTYSLQHTGPGFVATFKMQARRKSIVTGSNTTSKIECKSGWKQRHLSCYKFFQEKAPVSWSFAENNCIENGGHLLSIDDKHEMSYIYDLMMSDWITRNDVIIGLRKHDQRLRLGDLVWSSKRVATYLDWYPGQPDGYEIEQCTVMKPSSVWSTQSWHDASCAYRIYYNYICEVTADGDGIHSSQNNSMTNWTAEDWMFICKNGILISGVYKCDGINDCLDSSDEKGCDDYDRTSSFKCDDGKYIHMSLYCDHKADCDDHSDEKYCVFRDCKEKEWRCKNSQCIPEYERCDFKADCTDKSDEDNCVECNKEGFQCSNTICIPSSRVNDGFVDCAGKFPADETNPRIKLVEESCEAWYRLGKRESGIYRVRYGGEDSFPVECQFPNNNAGNMVKVILHHHLEGRRELVGDFQNIMYDATKDQIERLTDKCDCSQFLSIECAGIGLVEYAIKLPLGKLETTVSTKRALNGSMCGHEGYTRRLLQEQYIWNYDSLRFSFDDIPIQSIRDVTVVNVKRAISIGPVICTEHIQNITHNEFLCKNDIAIDRNHRCILNVDENGEVEGCRDLSNLEDCGNFACPTTHVKCPEHFCIPRHMYCDGLKHCPDGSDEVNCENATCPGLFKCHNSSVCLPPSEICDGIQRCKFGDDELLCDFHCPDYCHCEGLTVSCNNVPDPKQISNRSRKLVISDTKAVNGSLLFNDFSYLGQLIITNTDTELIENGPFKLLKNLFFLNLSRNLISKLDADSFIGLDNLINLDISMNNIWHIDYGTFHNVPMLQTLDIRGNRIETFQDSLFEDLSRLKYLYSDEYKFCCIKPESVIEENCFPNRDEFSSCEDLLRNEMMRMCLWAIGSVAFIGNGLSIIYRLCFARDSLKKSHGLFVLSLCCADFLMGVYLYIIAAADEYYRGRYIYSETFWRNSIGCKVAGFLATLSSEVSTTMLCVITLDRFIVIKYPFSDFKFTTFSAKVCLLILWGLNIGIAILPLTGIPYFQANFYSKSGTCLALPLTRDHAPGWEYSISVFLIYNSLAFVLIVIGQITIYVVIISTSTTIQKTGKQEQNVTVARNLFLIVATDFLCWFPIAIMGLVALSGHAVPGEVYAWTTVFILPINSALNPLLYTLKAYLQKKKMDRHKQQFSELTEQIDKLKRERVNSVKTETEVDSLRKQNERLQSQITELNSFLDLSKISDRTPEKSGTEYTGSQMTKI